MRLPTDHPGQAQGSHRPIYRTEPSTREPAAGGSEHLPPPIQTFWRKLFSPLRRGCESELPDSVLHDRIRDAPLGNLLAARAPGS